jgi:hypothetical protein
MPVLLRSIMVLCLVGNALALPGHRIFAQSCLQPEDLSAWVDQLNRPGCAFDGQRTSLVNGAPESCDGSWYELGGAARGFFINDQRIEFTGLEATFAVEGSLRGEYGQVVGDGLAIAYGELFLNQRFDQNILVDSPLRRSFANNFDVEPLQISQLGLLGVRGDLEFEVGRFVTPFGRYHGMSWQNDFVDTPFLRSEIIGFRETGAQIRWTPGIWRMAAAITNGGSNKDTNSSKAFVSRIGADLQNWSFGASLKSQDGVGSEGQKQFNDHIGIDWMIRLSDRLVVFGEVIHDKHGLRRPGTSLDEINWGRSLYNRQLNNGLDRPIEGNGAYISLIGQQPRFDWSLGYGEYRADRLGDLIHDTPVRQGMGQVAWHLSPAADFFSSVLIENTVNGTAHRPRSEGILYLAGLQMRF